jgi:hypothetical protein
MLKKQSHQYLCQKELIEFLFAFWSLALVFLTYTTGQSTADLKAKIGKNKYTKVENIASGSN